MNKKDLELLAGNVSGMLTGVVKMLLQSRPVESSGAPRPDQSLVIMGNGPSLKDVLDHRELLAGRKLLAVNFFANAPEFVETRPDFYVLCDPHFFDPEGDPNVDKLWRNLCSVTWPMTLFVPRGECRKASGRLRGASNIRLAAYNPVGIEGPEWFERMAFDARLAMPRPRNVLIPSIMIGLWLGFKEIYLTGADHSWMKTIRVNESNEVVSVQPHFYDDNESEQERVASVYKGVHLHDVVRSFYVAFHSYFAISRYAAHIGAHIYNATPGSFIDAFPRRALSEQP
ncbi:MAG: hypothetical protein J6C91_10545 [Muribaculaceae bacterium]|nr:hypothetical protein [Muribaculaceae bacterium]